MAKISGVHTSTRPLKNLIINGDMVIDQRNNGAAISAASTDNAYLTDRWLVGNSQNGKFNSGQNQSGFTTPTGFSKYLNMNCISTVSLAAGDYFFIQQRIEGQNIAQLAWGTSSAKAVTLSFWVRCSTAGTFGGSVGNNGSTRSYPFTYTINAPNTFEYKSVTIPGDVTGTWITTNGIGMIVYFGLGVGTTYSGSAGVWAGANYVSASGATSMVTSGQNWNITGVMLNEGKIAAPFRKFGEDCVGELNACLRYFQSFVSSANGDCIPGTGVWRSTTRFDTTHPLTVPMRITPGITAVSPSNINVYSGGGAAVASAIVNNGSTPYTVALNVTSSSGTVSAGGYLQCIAAGAGYTLSAEL